MPTKAQLEAALRNADKAGDTAAAKKLANALKSGSYTDAEPVAPQVASGEVPVPYGEPQAVPAVAPPERSLGEKLSGGAQALAASTIGGIPAMVGTGVGAAQGAVEYLGQGDFSQPPGELVKQRAMEGAQMLTPQPYTEAGQEYTRAAGEALSPLAALGGIAPILSAESGALRAGARSAAPAAQKALIQADSAFAAANEKIKGSLARRSRTLGQGESAGAAATPEAQQRVATAGSLPVPVTLTKGAAMREAEQLAFEKEQMKTALGGPLRDRIEENNLQILQNFDEFIDQSGAQAVHSGKADVGRSVTRALSQGLEEARRKTREAYHAADRSPEANAFARTDDLANYINGQVTGSPSVAIVDYLRNFMRKNEILPEADGNFSPNTLTVRQLEQLRQEINKNVGDDSANIRHAAIMKRLIDDATNEVAGPLYKRARSRRMQEANVFENRAVVARLLETRRGGKDPQVALDKVFDKTILNSSPQEINNFRRILNAHGDAGRQAWSDLQGATVDYIRAEATKNVGSDSAGNPIVSPAQLNRAINTLDSNGRLDVIFGKQQAQVIRDLNDVVKYVNTVPPGTLINSSGTAATLLAAMGEMGVTGVTTGLPVPVIMTLKVLRDKAKDRKIKRQIQDALDYSEKITQGNP